MRVKSQPIRALPLSSSPDHFNTADTGLSILNVCKASDVSSNPVREFSRGPGSRVARFTHHGKTPEFNESQMDIDGNEDEEDNDDYEYFLSPVYRRSNNFRRMDLLSQTSIQEFDSHSSSASNRSVSESPSKNTNDDIELANMFIAKAIEVSGRLSKRVPSQKLIQKLGMHTTKQQRAREFLRSIGAITVNFRTELAPSFSNLGDLQHFMLYNYNSLSIMEA